MKNSILSLQESPAGKWTAKYLGNYGTYTIRIQLDGSRMKDYSCNCPSDYYPCKHIAIIREAIKEQVAKNAKFYESSGDNIEKLVQNLSKKELKSFLLEQTKLNQQLANTLLLKFASKQKSEESGSNKYVAIIRNVLEKYDFDVSDMHDYYDDYYSEESYEINELDDWLEKANELVDSKNYSEAALICKALIEEYADWLNSADSEVVDYINPDFECVPFELLMQMGSDKNIDAGELYKYAQAEMEKPKYKSVGFYDSFNDLLAEIAVPEINGSEFIALQDLLLKEYGGKNSDFAETILSRKIRYYQINGMEDEAWKTFEDNLQIDAFREQVAKKRIEENKLGEAKKLIHDYLQGKKSTSYTSKSWNKLLLDIAIKENDKPEIRRIAKSFIQYNFERPYYAIYKSSFPRTEWAEAFEELLAHYQKSNHPQLSLNAADLLAEEKKIERLLDYVTRHCSTRTLESYYKHFVKAYPAETLRLFRLSIEDYAKNNLGRDHYEYIVRLMKLMQSIAGGTEVTAQMKSNFKSIYKNRRAMMEILEKVK